ncbi:RDD family protein [Wolbachia endosymbiont of Nilaparvata lugens]|uniref:RDD family protein n=1 Tax=Wolbachia endosymbiont of Nilaparvata lugens TaxID=357143 RepID=UPI00117C5F4F|nr:RDD family protein [Wolbachia endosymbiont of Nilaparvata lugens]
MDTKVNYAGIARRVIAHIIDCSVVMGASLVYCLLVIITLDLTESKYLIMYICLFFLLSIIFRVIMVKRVGGTPGQLLCCICIKDANTLKNVTLMQAIIRYALSEVVNPVLYFVLIICFCDFFDKYVPEWLFKPSLFLVFAATILVSIHAIFDRQKQFLHDKITRTVAIRL